MEEISTLKLSLRAINCLKSESITYMGDLVQRSPNELLKTPNLGSNTVRELQEIVLSRGLTLGMRIPNWDNRRLKREA
jgi:DNA-directed RNA polymerase subunit alpha